MLLYHSKDRHGTRVVTLGDVPYFDPNSKSQGEALGLDTVFCRSLNVEYYMNYVDDFTCISKATK